MHESSMHVLRGIPITNRFNSSVSVTGSFIAPCGPPYKVARSKKRIPSQKVVRIGPVTRFWNSYANSRTKTDTYLLHINQMVFNRKGCLGGSGGLLCGLGRCLGGRGGCCGALRRVLSLLCALLRGILGRLGHVVGMGLHQGLNSPASPHHCLFSGLRTNWIPPTPEFSLNLQFHTALTPDECSGRQSEAVRRCFSPAARICENLGLNFPNILRFHMAKSRKCSHPLTRRKISSYNIDKVP